MFYKLIYNRSIKEYKKSYFNIICIFIISLSMLSFINIYCDSYYNYNDAVLIPKLTDNYTCDIRITNIGEDEIEQYSNIPNIDMIYIDGNLDFFVINKHDFETARKNIAEVFNQTHAHVHEYTDTTPLLHVYYGIDVNDLYEVDDNARRTTSIFQFILTAIAIVAMSLLYSNYIDQRTDDIRTLSAIGITKRQLYRLFWGEYNILYTISAIIGVPLGGFFVYTFCKICDFIDMSQTNAIYPVFYLNLSSLIPIVLLGYIAINITFMIVFEKIMKIDASYTCADTIVEFDPSKTRGLYYKSERYFDSFYASVLQKRSSKKIKVLSFIVTLILGVSIFMMNIIGCAANMYNNGNGAEYAAFFSNSSLFLMIIVYAIIYSWIIISILTKQQMETLSQSTQMLYALGAEEDVLYLCFKRYTMQKVLFTLLFGGGIGIIASFIVLSASGVAFSLNLWFVLGNIVLLVLYHLVQTNCMKIGFFSNCRNTLGEEIGGK